MKKLPKIYQAEFNKKINNNKKTCYVESKLEEPLAEKSQTDIAEILDEVFSGIGYSYNIPLIIKTKDRVYNTSLIAKTKNNIITLDNEIIPVTEITDIEKKKNI